jgi:hypothetical protein
MSLKSFVIVAIIAGICAALYKLPYMTLNEMKAAAADAHPQKLSECVDFAALRADLRQQLTALTAERAKQKLDGSVLGNLAVAVGGALVDKVVDAVVTPDGLVHLFQGKSVLLGGAGQAVRVRPEDVEAVFHNAQYGYTSLSTFVVRFPSESGRPGNVALVFRRDGLTWRLSGMQLPPDVFDWIVRFGIKL